MTLATRSRITASVAVGLCAASCGRIGFDLLPSGSQQAVTNDAGATGTGGAGLDAAAGALNSGGSGGTSSGGRSGSGGSPATGGASSGGTAGAGGSGGIGDASTPDAAGGTQNGGASGTGGATSGGASNGGASSGGIPGTGGIGPDAGPPPVCASASGTIRVWSFDSTVESWAFWPNLGAGALSWTAATGNPAAGALSLDITSGNGVLGWIVMDSPAPDLSGQTGSVWLYLDSGSVGIKPYAQSNASNFAWADGGFVTLTPKTWTCVTIDFSSPVYKDAPFNPTNVVRFGVEVVGTGPLRLYADRFSY